MVNPSPLLPTLSRVTGEVCSIVEAAAPRWWWWALAVCGSGTLLCIACLVYLVATGVGVWGNNHPVGWAWDVTNFVFWIGIGHAGTLISAILFLTRQHWRTSINRAAEAMTLFAVLCAAIYPAFHLGRVWMVWNLLPVSNANGTWPNFSSPLLWDFFAISTYFTVSVLFWFTGLIPDLATLRDRCEDPVRKRLYGLFAIGWRGGNRQWQQHGMAYLLLAGVSTPLVLSVHSIVSLDFAVSILPGWHSTIFPPYFVAGAIFGGMAMVLTVIIPVRSLYPALRELITVRHLNSMCKVLLFTGCLIAYAYLMEVFGAWYGGDPAEREALRQRATGPLAWAFWAMIFCNAVVPQLFWFRFFRTHALWIWLLVQFPNVGMWLERFVIVVSSLTRDFLPSSWAGFRPTWVDICTFAGSFGLFLTLFLLFIRFLPMVCLFEVKSGLPGAQPRGRGGVP